MAIDPVCKMTVQEETAAATSEYKGETYYFCAEGCKVAFDKDPESFLPRSGLASRLRRLNPLRR